MQNYFKELIEKYPTLSHPSETMKEKKSNDVTTKQIRCDTSIIYFKINLFTGTLTYSEITK